MPAEGGEAVQLTKNGGTEGFESVDGQHLYFTKRGQGGGPFGIWRIPRDGGEETQIHNRGQSLLWELREKGIYCVNSDSTPSTVELLDLATGETREVAVLETTPFGYGFSVSPDERWILYIIMEPEQDIMLVENFR
jgi:hypothetical protein